jgi:hypothetical protein
MPLALRDISVGAVSYFEVDSLNRDSRITKPMFPTSRAGPFVCFEAQDGRSAWAAITSRQRADGKRLEIPRTARTGGSEKWRDVDLFLNDGACTYTGPDQAFVDAAQGERTFAASARPFIVAASIAQIVCEVDARKGNRL